jgi:hypothetical protein
VTTVQSVAAPASTKQKLWIALVSALAVILVIAAIVLQVRRSYEAKRGQRARCVDLSPYYNGVVTENWIRPDAAADNLGGIPRGIRVLGGVRFNVGAGLIQLNGRDLRRRNRSFPTEVTAIPIQQQCHRIHLLHSTMFRTAEGAPVSMLVLHYADGKEESLMLNFNYHFRHWWHNLSSDPNYRPGLPLSATTVEAWTGTNSLSRPGEYQRLFRTTFHNPRPRTAIQSIDYISVMSSSAPFLVALSVD